MEAADENIPAQAAQHLCPASPALLTEAERRFWLPELRELPQSRAELVLRSSGTSRVAPGPVSLLLSLTEPS